MSTEIKTGMRSVGVGVGVILLALGAAATFMSGTNGVGVGFLLAAGAVLLVLGMTGVVPQRIAVGKDTIEVAYAQGLAVATKETKKKAAEVVDQAAQDEGLKQQLAAAKDTDNAKEIIKRYITQAVEDKVPSAGERVVALFDRP